MPSSLRYRAAAALLSCLCAAPAATPAAAAAGTPVAADERPAPVSLTTLGTMTWGFYDPAVTTTWPAESAQVAAAMQQAVDDYNTVAAYSTFVPVTYNPGVPTAEASYGGSISFGGLRSARTAHHELSHVLGMQPWVDGGRARWSTLCENGWADTTALRRMRLFKGPTAGIGCSNDSGHFWDYGLNFDGEWNWLSKGRNIAMVGAMRADLGLSDGSTPAPRRYRLTNRLTGQLAADPRGVEGAAAVSAPSTVATTQQWVLSFADGFVRVKNLASGRFLDGSGRAATLVTVGAARTTWEMLPTTQGWFQLRNRSSGRCLGNPVADARLLVVPCGTNPESPPAAAQWHLARVPVAARSGALVATASGRCLDVPAPGTAGTRVRLLGCDGGTTQQWRWTVRGELRTPSGTCLDAWGAGRAPGTEVAVWTCTGAANQQWSLRADGSVAGVDSGLCLAPDGSGTADGTPVVLQTCTGGAGQRWSLRRAAAVPPA